MKNGDRVKYVGHKEGCVSCWAGQNPRSVFVSAWDNRIGVAGTVVGEESEGTVFVDFDNEARRCNVYASHLELQTAQKETR